MGRHKAFAGVVSSVIVLFLIFTGPSAFAKWVTFEEEYTYQASEADSKLSSRVIALEQVKRLLLEKLGTYLESETEVKNFQLTKDQIVVLTGGIVRAEIIDETWDGKKYSLKAKITADPQEMTQSIEKLRQDRQKTKELEEVRKQAQEALQELEKLKKELEMAKAGKDNFTQYNEAINRLGATDWVEKGNSLGIAGRHREAMEAFSKAIQLNPNDSMAYMGRGVASGFLGDQRQAIRDYDRAIQLNPNNAMAYTNRGAAFGNLGDHRQAIRDYDRAIQLNPNDAIAFVNRGIAYGNLGDHRRAIQEFDRAIQLNPNDAHAYNYRAIAYGFLGDQAQAINNYRAAARLGLQSAQDFLRSRKLNW